MEFQSVLKVYLMTKNGQNMAKMEKIRNIQMTDNKEDKFFYFPMISMPCTGSGYNKKATDNLLIIGRFFVGCNCKNDSLIAKLFCCCEWRYFCFAYSLTVVSFCPCFFLIVSAVWFLHATATGWGTRHNPGTLYRQLATAGVWKSAWRDNTPMHGPQAGSAYIGR